MLDRLASAPGGGHTLTQTKNPLNSVLKIDIAGGTIAALLIAGVAFVALRPVLNERRVADQRLVQLQTIESETNTALENLRATTRALNKAKLQAEGIPVRLGNTTDRNSKIADVVAQAETFELSVQTIRPGAVVRGERYSRTPLEISVRGSVSSVAGYLHEMHKVSTDLEITHLDIRGADGQAVVDAAIRADWITLTE